MEIYLLHTVTKISLNFHFISWAQDTEPALLKVSGNLSLPTIESTTKNIKLGRGFY